MARAKEKVSSLLGSVAFPLDAVAGTELVLYTVPTGKKAVIIEVVLHSFDEAVDEAVVTFGVSGGDCDEFLGDQTLTNVGAGYADEVLVCKPIQAATPVAQLLLDAAEEFAAEITTAETTGSAACVADVWGYEFDA